MENIIFTVLLFIGIVIFFFIIILLNRYCFFYVLLENNSIDLEKLNDVRIDLINTDKECIICLGNIENTTNSIILSCDHIYHYECFKKWYEKKNTCPLCRTAIK